MKKRLATIVCAFLVVSSLPALPGSSKLGILGADVVSAATDETAATPAKTTTPVKTSTKTTTTSSTTKITRMLAFGSYGDDVKALQSMLNTTGYKLDVDGIFGKLTEASVKDFQTKNNLRVDGVVGPNTLASLEAKVAALTKPAAPTKTTVPAKPATPTPKPATPKPTTPIDTVTSASVTDDAAVFEKSISKDGKWIICTTKDLTIKNALVVDGDFKNGKKDATTGAELYQRKIALYTQDDKHKVTGKFTLAAPKITFNSINGSIEHGTFKGDVYVAGKNFKLVNQTIEGNLYFLNEEAYNTFTIQDKTDDTKSVVTGKIELVQADAVTSASITDNAAVFEKSIGKDGKWIICTTKDLTLYKPLVVDGDFKNGKKDATTGAELYQRKIALYTQDENHKVTGKFTLTAPKITINSINGSIEHGTFNGDVYVAGKNFKLVNQTINGNLYFLNEEAQKTFAIQDKADDTKSVVTGKTELVTAVDAVSGASQVDDEAAFEQKISKANTNFMIIVNKDLTFTKDLIVESGIKKGTNGAADAPNRSIAPCHETADGKVDKKYTITVPNLVFNGENGKIEYGNVKGNVYVQAKGFKLTDATIDGDLYFATQELKDAFKLDTTTKITGQIAVKAYTK